MLYQILNGNFSLVSIIMQILATLFVMIVVLPFHELAHGFVAYKLGDNTAKNQGRLTFNPLHHINYVGAVCLLLVGFGWAEPVPVDPRYFKNPKRDMALVALAGPLTNLLLAFIFFLFGHFTGAFYYDGFGGMLCYVGMLLNMGFCLFNLIPIPPLDGSRVLYALAPDGARNFMESIEKYGIIIIYVLLLVGGTVFSKYMATGQSAILNAFYWIVGVR